MNLSLYSPLTWWPRLRGQLATARLARAVLAMDPVRVRAALRHASQVNPRLRLPANIRTPGLAGLADRPRALDYVLAISTRKQLHRHQQPVLAVARLLLSHGARLSHRGFPTASLALVQLRNLELLTVACANQPLWRMKFAWFSLVEGRPQPVRLSYEHHCDREGWHEGARYLRDCRAKEAALVSCVELENATATAVGPTRRSGRL